ncbi:hypothetical protein Tco_1243521 [Tanacetum coccineum]
MERTMFNLTTLTLSFLGLFLESAVRILNMVPTKKVDKTPYEIWHGKVPNMSYLKVWGCEAYVKRDSADKLKQRSVKYGDILFLERDLISQEFSGRDCDLEDDHIDTLPSENTSEIPVEPESLGPPPELIPVRRSERPKNAPNRLCLNMEVEDDEVGDLGEPANYRAAMIDPDKVLWQGAMDEEMKSMKVNKVHKADVALLKLGQSVSTASGEAPDWFRDASCNAIKMIQSLIRFSFVVNERRAVDWKESSRTTICDHATQSEYMAASEG